MMIEIMSISGELLLSVPVLIDSVVREELMTADYVQLSWNSEKGDILPVGSYIVHEGQKYSLLDNYAPSRVNEVEFKYTPQFQSRIMRWQKTIVPVYTYKEDGVTVKTRELDWNFTGTPMDAVSMVQQAIRNELGETWDVELDSDLPATISIASQSSTIWSLLSEIAELCETEWWADKSANYLYLKKCEHGVPVVLEVGKNIKTPNVTQNTDGLFTRFYAFGSTRNVTQSDSVVMGSIINKRLTLDPIKYPNGYKDIKGHFENGVFVSDLRPEEVFAMPLYFEDIYPSSSLVISGVRRRMRYYIDKETGEKIKVGGTDEAPVYDMYPIWYFSVEGFQFTDELIIKGQTLSVHFKSGKLRGREFELAYHSEDRKAADNEDVDPDFTVKAGEYEIIFDEQTEGFLIPDAEYIIPENGDEVTFFNIEMPSEYTSSAMAKLEEELDMEIERRTQDNNSYEFNSNPVAFYEDNTDVALGQRVTFINNGVALETRAMMVEKHLDFPFEQKIRVGNEIIKGSRQQLREEVREVGADVNKMREQGSVSASIQRENTRDLMLTMSKYFAMKDTIEMLQGALDGYSNGIDPITIQTMAIMVGDESLQFRFTPSRDNLTPINCPLVYDNATKRFDASPCAIIHLTLDIDAITAIGIRKASDYKSWNMEQWHSQIFDDPTAKYYVYAVVQKDGTIGSYEVSTTAIGMRDVAGSYHFLVGILNAEYAGVREFITLYGFTQVLPSQVTTDIIKSTDGQTYFDLLNGVISGRITFRTSAGTDKPMSEFADEQASNFSDVEKTIQQVQDQIDGVVENWSGYGAPTLDNEPYTSWPTDADKIAHINDTYINIEAYVDDETTPTAGHAWRWCECTDSSITDYVTVTDKDGKTYRLHWHEIADSDAVRALKEAAEAERKADEANKRVSDLEYLSKAFAKGETIIEGGVVMTQVVAVGEDSDSVSAILNGSDFASDTEHGKLILAGGIEDTDEDLEERVREASTRVYEDGTIASKKMILEDGCQIGDLVINDGYIGIGSTCVGTNIGEHNDGVNLSKYGASAGKYYNSGNSCETPSIAELTPEGIRAEHTDRYYIMSGVLRVAPMRASAPSGYSAYEAASGMFAGLRPQARVISSSGSSSNRIELSELDFSVLVNRTSGTCYLRLPETPQDGQEYYVESMCALNMIASHDVYRFYSGSTASAGTAFTTSERNVLRFKFYADANIWTCAAVV